MNRVAQVASTQLKPPVIIYGPQGCGKTLHANVLADFLGKSNIAEDWRVGDLLPPDTAAFTSDDIFAACNGYRSSCEHKGVAVLQFDAVLTAYSRAKSDAEQLAALPSWHTRTVGTTKAATRKAELSMFAALCVIDAEIENQGAISVSTINLVRSIIDNVAAGAA